MGRPPLGPSTWATFSARFRGGRRQPLDLHFGRPGICFLVGGASTLKPQGHVHPIARGWPFRCLGSGCQGEGQARGTRVVSMRSASASTSEIWQIVSWYTGRFGTLPFDRGVVWARRRHKSLLFIARFGVHCSGSYGLWVDMGILRRCPV